MRRSALVMMAMVFLAGCGTTPPTRFITLNVRGVGGAAERASARVGHAHTQPTTNGAAAPSAESGGSSNRAPSPGKPGAMWDGQTASPLMTWPAGGAVSIGKVTLPPALDRLSLVRRIGSNSLDIDGLVQWAGPLDVLIRRTLAMDLATHFPAGAVVMPSQPKPAGAMRLYVISLGTFSADAHNTVTLAAHWSLVDRKSTNVLKRGEAHIQILAASSKADDIATAMSEALAKLAGRLAEAL